MRPAVEREPDRSSLEALAALLLARAGLKITPSGYAGLALALRARLRGTSARDARDYVRLLEGEAGALELRALLPWVTVGKTEFFRDGRQLEAFERRVFPGLLAASQRAGRPVRLWSAGCATGEEPYSLALVAAAQGARAGAVDLWATDLNPAAIDTAKRGVYAERRLGGVRERQLHRFFRPADGQWRVADAVRAMVRFEVHNLAAPSWPLVSPGSLDAIFCRNVLIYFDAAGVDRVLARFHDALRPSGWLFLGYSEGLLQEKDGFELVDLDGTFAYRRAPSKRSRGQLEPPAAKPEGGRPQGRGPHRGPLAPPSTPEPPLTPTERLRQVRRAMEAGDFPAALRLAERLVDDFPAELAARLTLGNVHVVHGSLDEARRAFAAALAQEPLCVEARLFLGVAALAAGRAEQARLELTRALFLDPALPLGQYLLGQAHERLADLPAARRAYRNALGLARTPPRPLLGYFPDLPSSNRAVAEAARYRLASLAEGAR